MNISREFKSQHIEIWRVEDKFENEAYLAICDEMRESRFSDYLWLSKDDEAFFEPRPNYISVKYISTPKGIDSIEIEKIKELVENLLNHVAQAYCDWNIELIKLDSPQAVQEYISSVYKLKDYPVEAYMSLSQTRL